MLLCHSLQNSRTTLLGNLPKLSRYLLSPHQPSCTIACNSCKQNHSTPSDCSFYSMHLCSESQPWKKWYFKTGLPTRVMQFFWTRIMSGILQRSGILKIKVFFHNAYHKNSFSLQAYLPGMHFYYAERSHDWFWQSKYLPAMML